MKIIFLRIAIKTMFSQLPDEEIDESFTRTEIKRYTPYSIIDKAVYQEEILEVCKQGITYDREESIEWMVAFPMFIKANTRGLQTTIRAVGLTLQVPNSSIQELTEGLAGIDRRSISFYNYFVATN